MCSTSGCIGLLVAILICWLAILTVMLSDNYQSLKDGCPSSGYEKIVRDMLNQKQKSANKTIVVFGESGVGKSSVINMILDDAQADTSSAAIGCTFEHAKYDFYNYQLYDTVGVSEGSKGRVTKTEAIQKLVELIADLKQSNGINLLVLVMKMGRLSEFIQINYKMFVTLLGEDKVPVVLVITHAEDETTKNAWYTENQRHFKKYDMKFKNVTSVCATKGENRHPSLQCFYKNCYAESRYDVISLIERYVLEKPYTISEGSFGTTLKAVLNTFFDYIDWPLVLYRDLYNFLIENGFSEYDAVTTSNRIYKPKN